MRRAVSSLLCLSVLVFVASTAIVAFAPDGPAPAALPELIYDLPQSTPYATELVRPFLRPTGPALAALLLAVWGVLALYALRIWLLLRSDAPGPTHRSEILPMVVSLLAGALWPWLAEDHPQISFLICITMLVAAIAALMSRNPSPVARRGLPLLGFYAGWATVSTFGAFAALIVLDLGMAEWLAIFTTIAMLCIAAASVQIALPRVPTYTVAIIWALAGAASGMMADNIPAVLGAVMGIAALSIVLVRVST